MQVMLDREYSYRSRLNCEPPAEMPSKEFFYVTDMIQKDIKDEEEAARRAAQKRRQGRI